MQPLNLRISRTTFADCKVIFMYRLTNLSVRKVTFLLSAKIVRASLRLSLVWLSFDGSFHLASTCSLNVAMLRPCFLNLNKSLCASNWLPFPLNQ